MSPVRRWIVLNIPVHGKTPTGGWPHYLRHNIAAYISILLPRSKNVNGWVQHLATELRAAELRESDLEAKVQQSELAFAEAQQQMLQLQQVRRH